MIKTLNIPLMDGNKNIDLLSCFTFLLFAFQITGLHGQLSPRIANYTMEIRLDTAQKTLTASTVMSWKNISDQPVSELQMHMYYNAFRSSRSTFMEESIWIRGFLNAALQDDCGWSWSEITHFEDASGHILTDSLEYIQPDDGNDNDKTVLRIGLAEPVLPGQTATYRFDWEARIPKSMVRTGYNREYYFMAQWFPKLGVYEPAGMRYAKVDQWNCHQYHSTGEYYSDFGVYDVSITVPEGFVVGASGVLQERREDRGESTWRFVAEDVIDFTWATSPHFIENKYKWKDIDITLLTYPGHEHFKERYFNAIGNAFEYLHAHVGPYPYPVLTVVDPPIHGIFTGGMEYPMLVSSLSFCFFPEGFKAPETLVTHELIHQYFMQMVASNEQEEAWMDEGVTSYYEARIMDHYGGADRSQVKWLGMKFGNGEYNRYEFLNSPNPKIAGNDRKSWEFKYGGYGTIAYNKVAMALKTLEGLIGQEVFDDMMKTYFERWKFRHPCGRDLIEVANEVVTKHYGHTFGDSIHWFFDQFIYGTEACDYAVASVTNRKMLHSAGFVNDTENCLPLDLNNSKEGYESTVVVHRLGEAWLPVEILVKFNDGSSVLEQWDGKARAFDFKYVSEKRIVSAEVDPFRKNNMDCNFLNNSFIVSQKKNSIRKYIYQIITGIQHAMETMTILI